MLITTSTFTETEDRARQAHDAEGHRPEEAEDRAVGRRGYRRCISCMHLVLATDVEPLAPFVRG